MTFPVLDRSHAVALILGALLFELVLNLVSVPLEFATRPVINFVQTTANPLLSTMVAVVNLVGVATVLFLFTRAGVLGESPHETIWCRNARTLLAGRLVAIVYLALIPVNLVLGKVRTFFQIQVGNLTQIDMFSGPGALFALVAVPMVGAALVLLFGPTLIERSSRRAV